MCTYVFVCVISKAGVEKKTEDGVKIPAPLLPLAMFPTYCHGDRLCSWQDYLLRHLHPQALPSFVEQFTLDLSSSSLTQKYLCENQAQIFPRLALKQQERKKDLVEALKFQTPPFLSARVYLNKSDFFDPSYDTCSCPIRIRQEACWQQSVWVHRVPNRFFIWYSKLSDSLQQAPWEVGIIISFFRRGH